MRLHIIDQTEAYQEKLLPYLHLYVIKTYGCMKWYSIIIIPEVAKLLDKYSIYGDILFRDLIDEFAISLEIESKALLDNLSEFINVTKTIDTLC